MDEILLTVNGRTARCWEGGEENGRAVLLLHAGVGDAEAHWKQILPVLARTFHVLAPDLPGFGRSAALPEMTACAVVEWLHGLMQGLELDQAVLVGNSIGATIARLFAAAYPQQVPAVALVNGGVIPSPSRQEQMLYGMPVIGNLAAGLIGTGAASASAMHRLIHVRNEATDALIHAARANAAGTISVMGMNARPFPTERQPMIPVLLMWGVEDPYMTDERVEALQRELPGAQLAPIADCAHFPHLEAAEVFLFQVTQFLNRMTALPPLPGAGMLRTLG